MKRIFTVGVVSIIASFSISAAQKTLTGEISDSMCGASHTGMGEMGKNAKECTAGCVKGGAKYVFVSSGKVYAIQNQDFGTLAANSGAKVQLAGDVGKDGKTITVAKIAPAGK
jgi:hypothetical protein